MSWDEAWLEIQRRWLPDDTVRPDENYAAQLRVKFDTVASMSPAPKVIGEIGVRAGYSALAMLLAAPEARYIGIEQDRGQFGGEQGITERAVGTVLAGFNCEIVYADSQEIHQLPFHADFFHVDGDHSWDGAWHDLELAWRYSRFVLVDDYDYIRSVQAAVDHFIVTHRLVYPACQALGDGGFRGSMLLIGLREIELARAAHIAAAIEKARDA